MIVLFVYHHFNALQISSMLVLCYLQITVEAFVSMGNVCQQKKSQHNQAPLNAIISHNFLSRLQVSIIYSQLLAINTIYIVVQSHSYSMQVYRLCVVIIQCTDKALSTNFEIMIHLNTLNTSNFYCTYWFKKC